MIVQLLITPIFALLKWVLGLLPTMPSAPSWITSLVQVISYGLIIVPTDVWATLIGVVVFWRIALPAWAIIEWIYKKIPGVD